MTSPTLFGKTPAETDLFWANLQSAEGQRRQWQNQASAQVAQAIGDFHLRAPYADPGVALAVGQAAANGQVDPAQAAQAVDTAAAGGNRPAWSGTDCKVVYNTAGQVDPAKTLGLSGVAAHSDGGFDWSDPLGAIKDPAGFLAAVPDVAKGFTREALSVAQSSWEEVQNRAAQQVHNVGQIASDVGSGDISGALGAYGKTLTAATPFSPAGVATGAAGQAATSVTATNYYQQLAQAHQLGSVDLGSGFFPGGTVTNVWQPQAARDVRGTINGSAWTFGRQIADVVSQPGTKQYNIMSGLIDGAAQWVADPTIVLGDLLMESGKVGRAFEYAGKTAEEAAPAAEATPTAAKTVNPMNAAMSSAAGRSIIRDLQVAQSPQAVAAVIGSDIGGPALEKIAGLTKWSDIRAALRQAATTAPDWATEFQRVGGDAALHAAETSTPEEVAKAAAGVLIDGERQTVLPTRTDQFLDHPSTQGYLGRLAQTNDPLEVAARLGPQAPPSLVSAVTRAPDVDAVKAALRGELGLSIHDTSQLPGLQWGYETRRRVLQAFPGGDSGLLAHVPSNRAIRDGFAWDATPWDQRQALDHVDNAMRTAGVPYDARSRIYGQIADSFAAGTQEGKFRAMEGWAKAMRSSFVAQGMPEELAQKSTALWRDRGMARYGTEELAREAGWDQIATPDGPGDLSRAGPSLLSQGWNGAMDLPDWRAVRRTTSAWGRLWSTPSGAELKLPLNWVQSFAEDVWPKLAIGRAATALRITMDEQLKLAAYGLPNAVTHPLQWIGLVAGSSTDLERVGFEAQAAQDMLERVGASINRMDAPEQTLRRMKATNQWGLATREMPAERLEGALDRARQFAADPIASRVLQGQATDEIINWLHSPEGDTAFQKYLELGDSAVTRGADHRLVRAPVDLRDDGVLRGWIDQNIRANVDNLTRGNSDLRQAIGFNRVSGTANAEVGAAPQAFDQGGATPDFRRMMRDWVDSPEAPEQIDYNLKVPANSPKWNQWNRASDWWFSKLFGLPVGTLTRSPAFRTEFFSRLADLAPHLSPESANELLKTIDANATSQGFTGRVAEWLGGNDQLDRVIKAAGRASGDLTLDEATSYAKSHGIDAIKTMLYDASSKTNLEQSIRAISPFAHAWRSILTEWVRALGTNPGFVRRYQQTVQGGKDAGFFYVDPTSGKYVFNYPLSDWVMSHLATIGDTVAKAPVLGPGLAAAGALAGKLPVVGPEAQALLSPQKVIGGMIASGGNLPGVDPLRGEMNGLNLVTASFLPGLGPMAAWPASAILANRPEADFVRGLLMPYGVPSDENSPWFGQAGAYFTPAWASKIISAVTTSPDSASTFGNTYAQVLAQVASTGRYGNTPAEQRQMMEDARRKAQVLTVLRGVGQFVAPAAPSYAPEVAAKDGDVLMTALGADAHDMQARDPQNWVRDFVDKYGEGPFIATVSKTRAVQGGLDASTEFGNWTADHQAAMHSYPQVGGYFAPVGSDFDFEVYNRQVASGQRRRLTGQEMIDARDATLGKWRYDQYRKMLGPRPSVDQLNWLDAKKTELQQQYPGFATEPSVSAASLPTKVAQLDRAVRDPALKGDIQTATATYLHLRDQALTVAAQRAGGRQSASLSGSANADLRAWLLGKANDISTKYPTFSRLFDAVLAGEVHQ